MPGRRKRYNARFPPGRIKKIMQMDEEIGKVAATVPVIISRSVELFVKEFIDRVKDAASQGSGKTLVVKHINAVVQQNNKYDFLRDFITTFNTSSNESEEKQASKTGSTLNVKPRIRREAYERHLALFTDKKSATTSELPEQSSPCSLETVYTSPVPTISQPSWAPDVTAPPTFYNQLTQGTDWAQSDAALYQQQQQFAYMNSTAGSPPVPQIGVPEGLVGYGLPFPSTQGSYPYFDPSQHNAYTSPFGIMAAQHFENYQAAVEQQSEAVRVSEDPQNNPNAALSPTYSQPYVERNNRGGVNSAQTDASSPNIAAYV